MYNSIINKEMSVMEREQNVLKNGAIGTLVETT